MEALFGEGVGVKDYLYYGRGRGREDLGGERRVLYVVEGEAGAVGRVGLARVRWGVFRHRIQMPRGDAGLKDEVFVSRGDAVTVVDHDEGSVAAGVQGGGDVDVAGAGIAGVAQELEEGVLDGAKTPRAAPEAFCAQKAGEASSEVPVRSFQGVGKQSFPSGRPR